MRDPSAPVTVLTRLGSSPEIEFGLESGIWVDNPLAPSDPTFNDVKPVLKNALPTTIRPRSPSMEIEPSGI